MDPRKLQRVIVDALEDVKAQAIEVFNTSEQTSLFDRVILATGTSNRQTRALASHVRDKIKAAGGHVISVEGEDTGEWVLVDAGDAVVHIMQPAIRAYYNLEEIWGSKPVRLKRRTAGGRAADGESERAQPAGGLAQWEDAGESPELDDVVAASPKPAKAKSAPKAAPAKRPSAGKRAATASAARKSPAGTKGTKTTAARSTTERTPATRSTGARSASTRGATARGTSAASPARGATARGTSAASATRGATARGASTTSAARPAASARAKAARSAAPKPPAKARRTRAS